MSLLIAYALSEFIILNIAEFLVFLLWQIFLACTSSKIDERRVCGNSNDFDLRMKAG